MKKLLTSLVLAFCLIFTCVFAGCGGKEIKSISVTKMPRTQYEVGETLNLTDGEITVTYSDDSTEVVALTDSSVTIQKPNMNAVGEKTVSVTYNSVSTTFKITVTEAKLTVKFDMNYTGSQAREVKVDPNATVTAPEEPTRQGFAFLGWYVEAGASARFNFGNPVTQSTTVYAHWGYSVEFNLNHDGAKNPVEKVEAGATVAEPVNPERENNIFTGWFTEKDGDTEFDFKTVINANTTVFAGWKSVPAGASVFTVKFNVNDGSGAVRVRQVINGEKVAKPVDPQISGGEFGGWYTDAEFKTKFDFNSAVTADVTLYAKWNADSYTVTYNFNHADNNGVHTVQTVKSGRVVAAPADPELAGFYFAGWYRDTECSQKVSFDDRIEEFRHYYAKWLKEWEFQAEYTDFDGKEAFGYSANGTGPSAFINKNGAEKWGAHNGYWVANLHNKGLSVEFEIESDKEVFDAVLVMRLSADFFDITLHEGNFGIDINGETISYSEQIELTGAISAADGGIMNKRPFTNHTILRDVHLVKGKNTIVFNILDSQKYGEVGTMNATAPMIDSIYVNTNATLTWNPKLSNI